MKTRKNEVPSPSVFCAKMPDLLTLTNMNKLISVKIELVLGD
jgi:hypothetical protein